MDENRPKGWGSRVAGVARERVYSWRRRAATVGVGVLALFMAYGVVFGHNGLTAFAHKRDETRVLKQQMVVLEKENERLKGHADRLAMDAGAIEHEAREKLHYTRPGEVIITLPPKAASTGLVPDEKK